MQNNSPEGINQSNAKEVDDSQSVKMPQRFSNPYFKYRLWVSFLCNLIAWTMTTGLICGLMLVHSLDMLISGASGAVPDVYARSIQVVFLYVLPLFTCIGLHKWWLVRYFKSYQWEITGDALQIQEGVFTRKDTKILLSTIQSTGITQGFWERKYGWFKVTIATGGMSKDSKNPLSNIAAPIRGCQEPHVIQELIENAAREFKKQAGS